MLFNSYTFLFGFLPFTLAVFFALRWQTARIAFVVAASFAFYGWTVRWFPLLMAASMAASYGSGLVLARMQTERTRKAALAVGVTATLSLLLYFKYADFPVARSLQGVGDLSGFSVGSVRDFTRHIVLPIGISFYTFEGISYLVDIYRRQIEAERNLLRYAYFISFFPHLIAGPIIRYAKLGPQLRSFYRFDPNLFASGALLFSFGLAKKVLIADNIARWTDLYLAAPGNLGLLNSWGAMIGYAFQIYFDFSGYCDMALGVARMLGIELPWNFNRPYRAASPAEFWRRWNVTLSGWLRDYLYIPLGGNRCGTLRRDANLMATMAIGGLWHGAAVNFGLWGVYQGVLLVAHRRLQPLPIRVPRPVAVAVTFVLVVIGWVLFRMQGASAIGDVLTAMAGLNGLGAVSWSLVAWIALSGALMWGTPEEWTLSLGTWRWPRFAAVGVLAGVALIWLDQTRPFIYFRF
jgi:D-alanyl-lipoteichoic acid acyltransferase DltB (MBOAT superfamily)